MGSVELYLISLAFMMRISRPTMFWTRLCTLTCEFSKIYGFYDFHSGGVHIYLFKAIPPMTLPPSALSGPYVPVPLAVLTPDKRNSCSDFTGISCRVNGSCCVTLSPRPPRPVRR
ncbi:similar to CG15929-PA (predicted), isoform CRA_c [Rattus norvegicus]|uniref:Similar to CG15929-PA (Predicted), isoform CRA_c n=1 Tax=Rattus norvegicus TaxID=10116 RepID=A6JDX2_RAT|nr:similar to CG15929-PA (predicted), isoform CRA_c [Rattus norvegicus]